MIFFSTISAPSSLAHISNMILQFILRWHQSRCLGVTKNKLFMYKNVNRHLDPRCPLYRPASIHHFNAIYTLNRHVVWLFPSVFLERDPLKRANCFSSVCFTMEVRHGHLERLDVRLAVVLSWDRVTLDLLLAWAVQPERPHNYSASCSAMDGFFQYFRIFFYVSVCCLLERVTNHLEVVRALWRGCSPVQLHQVE